LRRKQHGQHAFGGGRGFPERTRRARRGRFLRIHEPSVRERERHDRDVLECDDGERPIPKTATFSVKGENVQGNTATVNITPAGGTDHTVNLSNENGNWKVDWPLDEWYGLAPGTRM